MCGEQAAGTRNVGKGVQIWVSIQTTWRSAHATGWGIKGLFSAFPFALDKSVVPATEVFPHAKWEQVFSSLFKYSEILRIKTHDEEMRIYHYRGNLLLICLNCVCFPAIITKVCHENEHLPVFSEAPSSQEIFLVTFGETCFFLLTRHNMPIKKKDALEKHYCLKHSPACFFVAPLVFFLGSDRF